MDNNKPLSDDQNSAYAFSSSGRSSKGFPRFLKVIFFLLLSYMLILIGVIAGSYFFPTLFHKDIQLNENQDARSGQNQGSRIRTQSALRTHSVSLPVDPNEVLVQEVITRVVVRGSIASVNRSGDEFILDISGSQEGIIEPITIPADVPAYETSDAAKAPKEIDISNLPQGRQVTIQYEYSAEIAEWTIVRIDVYTGS